MSLKRGTLALFAALVFICGGILGALVHRLYTVSSVRASVEPRSPEEGRRRMLKDVQEKLKLSDDQVSKLASIMDETRMRFQATRATIDPEMRRIREEEQQKIHAILSPEQQTLWDQRQREREANRAKKQRDGFPPPPRP